MGIKKFLLISLFCVIIVDLLGQKFEKNDFIGQIKAVISANLPVAFLGMHDLKIEHEGRYKQQIQSLSRAKNAPFEYLEWINTLELSWGENSSVFELVNELSQIVGGEKFIPKKNNRQSPLPKFSPKHREAIGDLLLALPIPLRPSFGNLLVAIQNSRKIHSEIEWSDDFQEGLQGLAGVSTNFQRATDNSNEVEFLKGPANDWKKNLEANLHVVWASYKFSEALKKYRSYNLTKFKKIFSTPLGEIAIGGIGSDVYSREFALIIDFGGNDQYLGPAASANARLPVSLLFDVAGDDVYRYSGPAQGSGIFGCGLLWDFSGNDIYEGGSLSQGVGVFGIGLLVDSQGRDSYKAIGQSQAFSAWGIGALIDEQGHDNYRGQFNCQAVSRTRGGSLLQDNSGNDFYILEGSEERRKHLKEYQISLGQGGSAGFSHLGLAGGFSVLHDLEGDDNYLSDISAQGVGLHSGSGHLWDREGEDNYSCQRSGISFADKSSVSFLLDKQGNDLYSLRAPFGIAGARNSSLAFLIDISGNDRYQGITECLGKSRRGSLALLVDLSGQDSYVGQDQDSSMLQTSRRPSLGIQVDCGGQDSYLSQGGDNKVFVSDNFSLNIDIESQQAKK